MLQGRISGIMDIKYGQRYDLLGEGFAHSTQFKTRATYGFQPVTVGKESAALVSMYIEKVRPLASKGMHDLDTSPLWLRFDGRQDLRVGKSFQHFFMTVRPNVALLPPMLLIMHPLRIWAWISLPPPSDL